MAYELLLAEAQGMSEATLMEVVRFMQFIKKEKANSEISETDEKPVIRKAGKYRGQIVIADDFDAPLEEFREYM